MALRILQPELVCLLVIYWIFSVPQHLGLTFAVLVGFVQDLIGQSVWGGHSIALALVAYICLTSYQRIVSYSIWHQTLWVLVIVGIHQLAIVWVLGLAGYPTGFIAFFIPILVTALFWPPVVIGMRTLRSKFGLL